MDLVQPIVGETPQLWVIAGVCVCVCVCDIYSYCMIIQLYLLVAMVTSASLRKNCDDRSIMVAGAGSHKVNDWSERGR